MSKQFRFLAVLAVLMAPICANANVITTSGNLAPGAVDYFWFNVADSGSFDLSLTSSDFDPELFLFRAPVSNGNFLETDDDSGSGLNSFIDRYLSVGSYVAAIGAWNLTQSEAVAGSNGGNGGGGLYNLNISSHNGTAETPRAVSEPGTIGLLGMGLVALAFVRRRKAA
jgi:hypothetical protein